VEPSTDSRRRSSQSDGHSATQATDARIVNDRRLPAVIFEEDGEPVAYAVYPEDATEIYLRHLRRKGIGRRAAEILLSQLWPKTKRLIVEVLTQNQSAVAFWRAMGYKDYSLALEIMPRR
jgi:predicted acetyltransferase